MYAADAVDFHAFFAGEAAAAVRHEAAVRVDHDLAAGESGVGHKAAQHEFAGRVDEYLDIGDVAEDRFENEFNESFADILLRDFFRVLRRDESP